MAREAGEINDGDLAENESADDEFKGDDSALQILRNMGAAGEVSLQKSFFVLLFFFDAL